MVEILCEVLGRRCHSHRMGKIDDSRQILLAVTFFQNLAHSDNGII